MAMEPIAGKPIALVSMPMHPARWPSYQLGLLTALLREQGLAVQPFSLFMYFGRHIGWRLNEALAAGYSNMLGEWLWAPEAFDFQGDPDTYRSDYAPVFREVCRTAGCRPEDVDRVREELAGSFLDFCLRSVDWSRFALVGFSVVFQQLLASLALARRLKERFPGLPVMLGGAAFEPDIAAELLRGCPQVDYIHCGEAEASLPEIARRLQAGRPFADVPGVLGREHGPVRLAGGATARADLAGSPVPDYDEYYYACRESGFEADHPGRSGMLPIETSRGCWWGSRSHCIFCGLHQPGDGYRVKPPGRTLEMLEALASRYPARRYFAIDNIMPPAYLSEVFDCLADQRSDLEFHYTTRPNLGREELRRLHRGGVRSIQPGVESLSTRLLRRRRKGTTARQNLELLKWATYYGIDNLYNLRWGGPGETAADYAEHCRVIRLIPHLQPPYMLARTRADRGSPMFCQPERFAVEDLRPAAGYEHLFPADRFDLRRVAYFFDHTQGDALPETARGELESLGADWRRRWHGPRRPTLRYFKRGDSLLVEERRRDTPRDHVLAGPAARVLEACADACRPDRLGERCDLPAAAIERILGELVRAELVLPLDGYCLSLVLPTHRDY